MNKLEIVIKLILYVLKEKNFAHLHWTVAGSEGRCTIFVVTTEPLTLVTFQENSFPKHA